MSVQQSVTTSLFNITVPWWELAIRGVVVYGFLLIMLRITGKRQVGQLAPFDLVLLLVLSNAVQNSMNAGDNSLVGGLISAATLIGLNHIVSLVTFKSKKLSLLVEGKPQILLHNGKIDEYELSNAQMTHHELNAAIRRAGYGSSEEVRFAVLENNGSLSVIGHEHRKTPLNDNQENQSK